MQYYSHLVTCVVVGPNVILSLVVLDPARQEVFLWIQYEHGDVMDENEWVHEGSKWYCKVDACTYSYTAKWLFCKHLERTHSIRMQTGRLGCPFSYPRGPKQQDHGSLNARILSNPHVRQKWNEKRVFKWMKKKAKLEWDEFQVQVQQMEQVRWPLLVCLTSKILLGIIGILAWGVGFIPQSAWVHLEKDDNLVEAIWESIVAYAKLFKVAWGNQNWTLESNKHKWAKEMDVISNYHNFKIINGQYMFP